MKWVAHNVMRILYLEKPNDNNVPLWENMLYIEADDVDTAYKIAEEQGRRSEDKSEFFACDGIPAHLLFVGTRKLISIEEPLVSGDEFTYLQLVVKDEAELEQLMTRQPVYPLFDDRDSDDDSEEESSP